MNESFFNLCFVRISVDAYDTLVQLVRKEVDWTLLHEVPATGKRVRAFGEDVECHHERIIHLLQVSIVRREFEPGQIEGERNLRMPFGVKCGTRIGQDLAGHFGRDIVSFAARVYAVYAPRRSAIYNTRIIHFPSSHFVECLSM